MQPHEHLMSLIAGPFSTLSRTAPLDLDPASDEEAPEFGRSGHFLPRYERYPGEVEFADWQDELAHIGGLYDTP
jgi:hypothetical protein